MRSIRKNIAPYLCTQAYLPNDDAQSKRSGISVLISKTSVGGNYLFAADVSYVL